MPAALAIVGAQLGQVLHVDVDEAEIVLLEGAAAPPGPARSRQAAQPFGPENAIDAVAVQMWQEVAHHKGEIVKGKAGGPAQGTDDGPLLVCGLPGQRVGTAGAIPAGIRAAL